MSEALYSQDAYLKSCEATVTAVDERGIRLDRTVFYAMGGGQPGDSGALKLSDGRSIKIIDTHKGDGDDIVHIPTENESGTLLQVGDTVTAEIDWERRYRHMRMHTCMHLLCAVVDEPVTGGSIGADRARLDFDIPDPILDKQKLTDELNRLITENHKVDTRWISAAELDAQPDLVKTMSVQPPRGQGKVRLLAIEDVDLQPCGGTHVANTGEIGRVKVAKIEKKSKHNRRVIVTFDE
jgi:misacylated tRNA(Ala) deacylase